ncbi:hypothetical protein MVEN_01103300 [Mycena venus]|uniref:Uncharacterized protein n=1 Tax=Mycena venus TaxID=2733690 RepID=A0A8H6Y959_9AGAR|nr:hypothetical protein MVEN_01103300 [Mycena venus]
MHFKEVMLASFLPSFPSSCCSISLGCSYHTHHASRRLLLLPPPSIPMLITFRSQCADCSFDGREKNGAFFGFDPIDREDIEARPPL